MRQVFSQTVYERVLSDLEVFTGTPLPPTDVWQWESGSILEWESGDDINLE